MIAIRYRRKPIKKRVEWEHLEQSALIERVRLELEPKFPECKWLYAVPNEGGSGNAGRIRTAIMKEEGMRSGVSDLCLPSPRIRPSAENLIKKRFVYSQFPYFCGLIIEMKPKPLISPIRGKISRKPMSAEQESYQVFVRSQGYAAFCCHGQDEAFQCLEAYLYLRRIDAQALDVKWHDFNPELHSYA